MKLFAVVFLATTLASCCNHQPCIQPPPMSTDQENSVAISLAAQLANIPAGGSLSTTFNDIVKNEYAMLNDNDKTLFLFLTAIQCYLKDGKVGETIATQMAQIVKDRYDVKVAATPPTQRTAHSEYREKDKDLLQKLGVKP